MAISKNPMQYIGLATKSLHISDQEDMGHIYNQSRLYRSCLSSLLFLQILLKLTKCFRKNLLIFSDLSIPCEKRLYFK